MNNSRKNIVKKQSITNNTKKKNINDKPFNKDSFIKKYQWQWSLLAILICTFIVFYPALFNSFVNWDDDKLIYENPYVVSFSFQQILPIFSAIDKHDPLTIISHGITYSFWKNNPFPYYLFNILLHLANISLVFYFIKKISNKYWVTILATILFAIHPFKAESVAWASERKDLLYGFFYLLALIFYDKYLLKSNWFAYFLSICFILFSHLSKFAAITFPIVIILLDYYRNKKLNVYAVLNKIPYFIITISFGIFYITKIGIESPMSTSIVNYTFFDRILLGCYSFLFYLIEFFVPFFMSPMHPYPLKLNENLPLIYYISAIGVLIFLISALVLFRRIKSFEKEYIFGIGIFLVAISLVLHIIPLGGNVVVAERYTYIAYIGLCFISASAIDSLLLNSKFHNGFIYKIRFILLISIFLAFAIITRQRVSVWNNNFSLYNEVLKKYPKAELAYYNRGLAFLKQNNLEESFNDFSKSISINSQYPNVFNNRANVFYQLGKYKEAIIDCDAAIKIDSNFSDAYNTRALANMQFNEAEKVFSDLNRAIVILPTFAEAYNNRGIAYANYKKDLKTAIVDFKKAISLNDSYAEAFCNLGIAYNSTDSLKNAIEAYNQAIVINPNYGSAYCNRGISFQKLGKLNEACRDFKMANSLNFSAAQEYLKKFCQ